MLSVPLLDKGMKRFVPGGGVGGTKGTAPALKTKDGALGFMLAVC